MSRGSKIVIFKNAGECFFQRRGIKRKLVPRDSHLGLIERHGEILINAMRILDSAAEAEGTRALEGFEVIAAIAEEVDRPSYTIPKAMFLSIGITLVIYLLLLFVMVTIAVLTAVTVPAQRSTRRWSTSASPLRKKTRACCWS